MATTTSTAFSAVLPRFSPPIHHRFHKFTLLVSQTKRPVLKTLTCKAMAGDILGDFGARDPFPAEIESKFGEKVLGNVDTEHKILIPNITALSLAEQQCSPLSSLEGPLSIVDAQSLLRKVLPF